MLYKLIVIILVFVFIYKCILPYISLLLHNNLFNIQLCLISINIVNNINISSSNDNTYNL